MTIYHEAKSLPSQRAGQLGHRLVEGDVLEELHPREEYADGHGRLEHCPEIAQGREVCIVIRILHKKLSRLVSAFNSSKVPTTIMRLLSRPSPRSRNPNAHLKQSLEVFGDHE